MGFLNHATNNIIIDAVLTERGRELLSKNDGSFSIESFTFGDDEVDYSLITKYGVDLGKEKIEKNTPIFEANPNENIAIKHTLISFPSPLKRIKEIPFLQRFGTNSSGEIDLFDIRGSDGKNPVLADISIRNALTETPATIDPNISDLVFYVKVHGELLKLNTDNATLVDTDINNIDTYEVPTVKITGNNITNQRGATFEIFSLGVVSSNSFKNFSQIGDNGVINTSVQVIGASSGSSIIVPVTINKDATT